MKNLPGGPQFSTYSQQITAIFQTMWSSKQTHVHFLNWRHPSERSDIQLSQLTPVIFDQGLQEKNRKKLLYHLV